MKQSLLFTHAIREVPKDEVSKNAELLIRGGFIDKLTAGVYTYLPLGLRVLNRIEQIIREEMNTIGGQEILMPALQPKELWDTTNRWDAMDVLFRLEGAGDKEYALGATHEEVVTPVAQKFLFSYRDLPRAIYQIQTKFRNEPRAKSGLLRGREFRMKDLYSFHTSTADLETYYEQAKTAYERVYDRCGLKEITYLTYASGGVFSQYSHEYQVLTQSGEDVIYVCSDCHIAVNREILSDLKNSCPKCQRTTLQEQKAIEVGNIFQLGTRFSDAFGFSYTDEGGKPQPVIMGCYGIGSSRLMGAIAEIFHDEKGLCWPKTVAPFTVHLVSLAQTDADRAVADTLYRTLTASGIDVLYDDRLDARAGEKFADSDLFGIPLRLVVSAKTIAKNSVEVKLRTVPDATLIPIDGAVSYVQSSL